MFVRKFISLLIVTILNWVPSFDKAEDSKASMYNNPIDSDFEFYSYDEMDSDNIFYSRRYKVGFYAHKYILADSSPVFKKMFYGGPFLDYINEDVNKEIMAAFLGFIYKDECPNNTETFMKVLVLTRKYKVISFETTCKLEFKVPWPAFKVIEKS